MNLISLTIEAGIMFQILQLKQKTPFFIVEVKGEDKINDADVIAKGKKAVMFCDVASSWSKTNNGKEWKYVFIPSKEIIPTSSFDNIAKRFTK